MRRQRAITPGATYAGTVTEPSESVNAAFDAVREVERVERDDAINDELAQTDRLAQSLGTAAKSLTTD